MKALVVGMGKSGLSMARHFINHGYTVCAVDSRVAPPCEAEFAALSGVEKNITGEQISAWNATAFEEFVRVGKSPGVPMSAVAAAGDKVIGDAGLFAESWRKNPLPIKLLAVTGTNGKSTVVSMAAAMCCAAGETAEAVGNIGEPLLDALARWQQSKMPTVAAVELSSFQLETAVDFPSFSAAVLNISPDHLDRHESLMEYARIKSSIYHAANYQAVNIDDEFYSLAMASVNNNADANIKDKTITTFSQKQHADWQLSGGEIRSDSAVFALDKMSPSAPPQNALAALALLSPLQLPEDACMTALANFGGLPHRRCIVANHDHVLYVNDSKATNVEAACFALRETAGDIVLIAGGDGKGQDFSKLATACQHVRLAILIGQDALLLQQAFSAAKVPTQIAPHMTAATGMAAAAASAGDTVLLSPACASLDAYPNYAARGDDFTAACRRLGEESLYAAQ